MLMRTIVGAAAMFFSVTASATPLAITTSVGTRIEDGATFDSVFDLSGVRAAAGLSGLPLNLDSGTVVIEFTDDFDLQRLITTTRIKRREACDFVGGSFTCSTLSNVVDATVESDIDPIETAFVTLAGEEFNASSSLRERTSTLLTEYRKTHQVCGGFGGICTVVEDTVIRRECETFLGTCEDKVYPLYESFTKFVESWDGPFSVTLQLGAAALADLAEDGVLAFSVGSVAGDFDFASASLRVDVADVDTRQLALPPSLPLAALASFALIASRRRVWRAS